jgi:GAF domain-containing protein
MKATTHTLTWRELLGRIIEEPGERQRIADVARIHPLTLTRWVAGESDPRPTSFQALLEAVPQHRQQLLDLILLEFPDYPVPAEEAEDEERVPVESPTISTFFYQKVLKTSATTTTLLRFWSICNLVLAQALNQFAKEGGVAITVVQCVPPRPGNKVRCLRQTVELGTPPWRSDLAEKAWFLGAESLAGHAIAVNHLVAVQNIEENPEHLPARRIDFERSIAAVPLLRSGRVAGSLTLSCVSPDSFTDARLSLLEQYALLVSVAFDDADFYAPQDIELRVMAPYADQQAQFATFRQRVNQLLAKAAERQQPLTLAQAELIVRQQLAEELVRQG